MHEEKMSAFGGKKEKSENLALMIGFGLIFVVIVFTLFRNNVFSDPENADQDVENQDSQSSATLPYKAISPKDLNKKIMGIGKKENLTLLDIRPFDSYIQEHILDSMNISLDEFPVGLKIDTRSLVIVIGASAQDKDIASAVEKLKEEKIENLLVLAGGMDSWKQLIGATVTYGDPKSFVDQSKVSYLDPEQLNDALTQKVPVYIVDVRNSENFAKGHISGAKNVPFEELEKKRSEIKEKKVVVVGENELQEFQASVQIYDMLLASPYVMRTAMPGWQDKKFPLVTN